MSYRPYYNASTFRSPSTHINSMDLLEDMDKPQLQAIGLSVARFYAKQLVSQPFEVAEFLLQTHDFSQKGRYVSPTAEESDSDEDIDYFTDDSQIKALPYRKKTRKRPTKLHEISTNLQLVPVDSPQLTPQHHMNAYSAPTIFGTLNTTIDRDGPVGLWRGINTGCLYVAATSMLEAWLQGFLSACFGIPDTQFGDIMQSSDPQLFLLIGAVSSGMAHLLVSPVSIIRARMLVTTMAGPRSLRSSLLRMPSCPSWVWLPKICSQVWSKVVELATPLLLFHELAIDEFRFPGSYNITSLGVELASLIVKIPLDTFANRAQVSALNLDPEALIINPVPYHGLLHSILDVLMFRVPLTSLYRGWRLEMIRVLSKWGYMTLETNTHIKERF